MQEKEDLLVRRLYGEHDRDHRARMAVAGSRRRLGAGKHLANSVNPASKATGEPEKG